MALQTLGTPQTNYEGEEDLDSLSNLKVYISPWLSHMGTFKLIGYPLWPS